MNPRPAIALSLLLTATVAAGAAEGVDPLSVIAFDMNRLDAAGLQGPPDGLRALDYEFCIPQGEILREQVATIDPSARFQPGSRGRIGCGPAEILVLGNTHRDGYRQILLRLAGLPYVVRITEALFE